MPVVCLSAESIYRYLDGDLSASEQDDLEAHLADCPSCRGAVETRRAIGEAAADLPRFEVPADFAVRIMKNIPPERKRAKVAGWLGAALGGVFGLGMAAVLIAVASGATLSQAFVRFNAWIWEALRNAAVLFVKGLKLAAVAAETIRTFTSLIAPEAWAAFIATSLLLALFGVFCWRRRRSFAEKRHES